MIPTIGKIRFVWGCIYDLYMGGGGWWFGLVINKKNHSLEFMNHGEYFFSFVGLNNSYDLIHVATI